MLSLNFLDTYSRFKEYSILEISHSNPLLCGFINNFKHCAISPHLFLFQLLHFLTFSFQSIFLSLSGPVSFIFPFLSHHLHDFVQSWTSLLCYFIGPRYTHTHTHTHTHKYKLQQASKNVGSRAKPFFLNFFILSVKF